MRSTLLGDAPSVHGVPGCTRTCQATIRLARLRTAPWWDHVESAARPSDGGSRTGVSDPVAAALGFVLVQAEFPSDVLKFSGIAFDSGFCSVAYS